MGGGGGTYGSFYSNICRLLSTLNGGIVHQRPTVRLPLSKVGLELGRLLSNLGVVRGVAVEQRVARVKPHARLWDPSITSITSSRQAAGYPAMYLSLALNWDKHSPLWAPSALAAAPPQQPHEQAAGGTTAVAAAAAGAGGDAAWRAALLAGFSPPQGVNSPTPSRLRILSRPSVQRWVGLRELLAARRANVPGVYLLSTSAGLLTDIDCELRGIGGTLLAHLALPMGHVVQLRGWLRHKYAVENAAAPGSGQLGDSSSSGVQHKQQQQHVPLAEWDSRGQVVSLLLPRLADSQADALAYLERLQEDAAAAASGEGPDAPLPAQLLARAREQLLQLEMQELAVRARGADTPLVPAAADSRRRGGGGGGRRGGGGSSRSGGGGGRADDRWQPSS